MKFLIDVIFINFNEWVSFFVKKITFNKIYLYLTLFGLLILLMKIQVFLQQILNIFGDFFSTQIFTLKMVNFNLNFKLEEKI